MKSKKICADIPQHSSTATIRALLEGFSALRELRDDVELVLASRRHVLEEFSVWNYIDEHQLTDSVTYLPYYQTCTSFPFFKQDADLWIDRDSSLESLDEKSLSRQLDNPTVASKKNRSIHNQLSPREARR